MQEKNPPPVDSQVLWSALFHLAESLIDYRSRKVEQLDRDHNALSPADRFCLQFYDHLVDCYLRERLRNLAIPVDVAYRRYMKDREMSLARFLRRIKPTSRRDYLIFLDELDEKAEAINVAFVRSQPIPLKIASAGDPKYRDLAEKQVYQILSFEEQILDLIHPLSDFESELWKLQVNKGVSDKFINELRDALKNIPDGDRYYVAYGLSNLRDLHLEFEEKEEYTQDIFDLHLDDKIRKSHEYHLRAIDDFHAFLDNLASLSTNKFYVAKKSYEIAQNNRNEALDAVKRLLSPPTKLANDPDSLRQTGISRLKQSNLLFPGGDPLKLLSNDPLLHDLGCGREQIMKEVDYLRRNPGGKRQLSNIKIRLAVDSLDTLAAEVEAHNREARAIYMEKIVLNNLRSIGFDDDDGRSIYLRAIREGMSEIAFNILVLQIRDNGVRDKAARFLDTAFILEEQGRLLQAIKADDRTRKMFNLFGGQGPRELALTFALMYQEISAVIEHAFLENLADKSDSGVSAIKDSLTPAKLLLERAMRDYINVAGLHFSRSTYEDTLDILQLAAVRSDLIDAPALRQEGLLYRLIPRIVIELARWAQAKAGPVLSTHEMSAFLDKELKSKADLQKLKTHFDKFVPLWDESARTDNASLGPLEVDDDLKRRLTDNAGFGYFDELTRVSGIVDRFRKFGMGLRYHRGMHQARSLLPAIKAALELPSVGRNEQAARMLQEAAAGIDALADPLEEV